MLARFSLSLLALLVFALGTFKVWPFSLYRLGTIQTPRLLGH